MILGGIYIDPNNNWILAIKENELSDGEKKALLLEGNKVLLLRSEGAFFAMSNECPHMQCPLSKGTMEGHVIKCSCHDWRFDIRSGEFIDANEIKLPVYKTKIVDGSVFVSLSQSLNSNEEGTGI